MKKELTWSFSVIEIPETQFPIYACDTNWGANCYFTRPLYDPRADEVPFQGPDESKVND